MMATHAAASVSISRGQARSPDIRACRRVCKLAELLGRVAARLRHRVSVNEAGRAAVHGRRPVASRRAHQQLAVVDALHVGVLNGRAAAPLDQPRRLLHEVPDTLLHRHGLVCGRMSTIPPKASAGCGNDQ